MELRWGSDGVNLMSVKISLVYFGVDKHRRKFVGASVKEKGATSTCGFCTKISEERICLGGWAERDVLPMRNIYLVMRKFRRCGVVGSRGRYESSADAKGFCAGFSGNLPLPVQGQMANGSEGKRCL